MDQAKLVELLNEDLELEYRSIVQYTQHIASVKGAQYQSTLDELGAHCARNWITLTLAADRLPRRRAVDERPDVPHAVDARRLQDDLDLETNQLERYRERVDRRQGFAPRCGGGLGPAPGADPRTRA